MSTASSVDTDTTRSLREAMVEELIHSGDLTDPVWIRAFRAVPRHCFVPRFHPDPRTIVDGGDPDQADAWLRAVYSDTTLVTQRYPDGVTSSGTMPGLIGLMLQALDVDPAHTVLQAGTGTGYTAGLLCERLGSDRVVSIDVDPDLTTAAQERLRGCGYTPAVIAADAASGWSARAPYDRIMATFAVRTIPEAWLAQTRDGGVILTPIRSALARLTLRAGIAEGRFLPGGAYFMRHRPTSHSTADPARGCRVADGPVWPRREPQLSSSIVWDNQLKFVIDVTMPDLTVGHGPGGLHDVVLTTPDGSRARHTTDGELHQTGPRPLWDEVEAAHHRWQDWGTPGRHRFGLTAEPTHQRVWLDHPSRIVAELSG